MKTIYLGAGGFWTIEAVFKQVKGVAEVIPGYMGGTVENPSHEIVATGTTGHAEVVKVMYDENELSISDVLRIFFAMHDASVPLHNMNGVGSQYRSVIFYTDDTEAEATDPTNGDGVGVIQQIVEALQPTLPEGVSIATRVLSAGVFYPAEELHYDYYNQHQGDVYSVTVITPKLRDMKYQFPDKFL